MIKLLPMGTLVLQVLVRFDGAGVLFVEWAVVGVAVGSGVGDVVGSGVGVGVPVEVGVGVGSGVDVSVGVGEGVRVEPGANVAEMKYATLTLYTMHELTGLCR